MQEGQGCSRPSLPPLSASPARPGRPPLPEPSLQVRAGLRAGQGAVRGRRTPRCSEIVSRGGRRAVFTRERGESFRCPVPGRRRLRGFPEDARRRWHRCARGRESRSRSRCCQRHAASPRCASAPRALPAAGLLRKLLPSVLSAVPRPFPRRFSPPFHQCLRDAHGNPPAECPHTGDAAQLPPRVLCHSFGVIRSVQPGEEETEGTPHPSLQLYKFTTS